ncbi:butyrate kinase [Thermotomaculum hydrothermale]|uniref:Probable butyrate kinase n=1 Tax=Thermotomaculum hydrothermale TaxID=981385 RepID=A0A7R6SZD0_9BACT|nr:butyrate kinase [Thermotomaculum hydrothermale]BBB33526.1 butyrate kinase [Thermotomaculum hydrothermale]
MTYKILTINPGSTSTKVGLFEGSNPIKVENLKHDSNELLQFNSVYEQFPFRKKAIMDFLNTNGIELKEIDAFAGRGGLLKPIPGGVYRVNTLMKRHLKYAKFGEHASNLGAILADELAKEAGDKPAFIVDPPVVDEMIEEARYSGMPENPRKSVFHALNQKAVARRYADSIGKKYNELNLVVAHLGGGITIGAHRKGRVIDVNDGLSGDGPFSPERSGGVPTLKLIELCYSGKYEPETMKRKAVGKGGLVAYLKTSDAIKIEEMIKQGDKKAETVYRAMAYQVAKEIGAYHVALSCETDAIIITGGLAHSEMLVSWIKERVESLAKIVVFPGEDELLALAEGSIKALNGEIEIMEYE